MPYKVSECCLLFEGLLSIMVQSRMPRAHRTCATINEAQEWPVDTEEDTTLSSDPSQGSQAPDSRVAKAMQGQDDLRAG